MKSVRTAIIAAITAVVSALIGCVMDNNPVIYNTGIALSLVSLGIYIGALMVYTYRQESSDNNKEYRAAKKAEKMYIRNAG